MPTNELKVIFTTDTTEFKKGVDGAKDALKDFSGEEEKTAVSTKKLGDQLKSADVDTKKVKDAIGKGAKALTGFDFGMRGSAAATKAAKRKQLTELLENRKLDDQANLSTAEIEKLIAEL
jgi:hypothetical protein